MTKYAVSLGGSNLGGIIWDDASPNQQGPISLREIGGAAVADGKALISGGGGGGFRPLALTDTSLGLVSGPGSSSDNNLVRWDGTTGQLIQNSGVDLDDSNNLTGIVNLEMTGTLTVTSMNVAGFVKNSAAGVLSGGYGSGGSGLIDISADTNLAVTAPIVLTGDTLSLAHNTTNMQVTAGQINTIQDIATSSSPTFSNLTLNGTALTATSASSINWLIDSAGSALFYMDRGSTSFNVGHALRTAGVTKWFIGVDDDTTDDFYILDGVDGASALSITRSTRLVTIGTDLTVSDDLTVTGDITQTGTGSTTFRNTAGGKTVAIQGDTTFSQLHIIGYKAASDPVAGDIRFHAGRGDATTPLVITDTAALGRVRGYGYDGVSAFQVAASIELYSGTGTQSATSMPGQIRFLTCPDASITPTLALTINETQDLLIVNQLIGTVDADSYLNLNGTAGDVELASADDMIFRIDSDNNTTGKTFSFQHNASTELFRIDDTGLITGATLAPGINTAGTYFRTNLATTSWPFTIGMIYDSNYGEHYIGLNSRLDGGTKLAPTFTCNGGGYIKNLIYSGTATERGISIGTIPVGSAQSPVERLRITHGGGSSFYAGATELFRIEDDGDVHVLVGDLYVKDQIVSIDYTAYIDMNLLTGILLSSHVGFMVDIEADGGTTGNFIVSTNGQATTLFKVRSLDGDCELDAGSLVINAAGQGLRVKEGSNAYMGAATLVAGTKTVSNTSVTANTNIFLSRSTTGGTVGHLSYTIVAATSFTINSTSVLETSTIEWFFVEPA